MPPSGQEADAETTQEPELKKPQNMIQLARQKLGLPKRQLERNDSKNDYSPLFYR